MLRIPLDRSDWTRGTRDKLHSRSDVFEDLYPDECVEGLENPF